MALLADLFGLPGPAPGRDALDDPSDLLRRAIRLNQGVEVAPAVETIAPPLDTRTVQEYPVANVAGQSAAPAVSPPATSPIVTGSAQQAAQAPPELTIGDRIGRFLMAGSEGSLARGIGKATYGADREQQTENETIRLLMDRAGLSQGQAIAVSRNPTIMNQILPQIFGPKPSNQKIGAGEALIGPKGDVIYRNDEAKPQQHVLAPGAALTDSAGNILTQNDPKAKEPPAGYEWIDPRDPSKGVAAISGGPATKGTGELAGKLALMKTARDGIRATRDVLTNSWGVGGAIQSGLSDAIPAWSGNIGEAQRNVRAGVEAALRIMTGAAAPEQEVVRYANLFTPNARDDAKSAKQKLDLLERFMDEAEGFARQGHLTREEMAGRKASTSEAKPSGAPARAVDPVGLR